MFRASFNRRRLQSSAFRRRFLLVLLAACVPLLAISLAFNLRLLRDHKQNAERVVDSLSSQAGGAIASSFRTANDLSRTLSLNSLLQKDILPRTVPDSWNQINRNILDLQSMIKNYLFIDGIDGIHFYLPGGLVIANGEDFFDMEDAADEPWYADFQASPAALRFYPAVSTKGAAEIDTLSVVRTLFNPLNYREMMGYVRIDVSLSHVREVLESCSVYEGALCALLDAQGRPLLYGGNSDASPLEALVLPEGMEEGAALSDYIALAGRRCLINCRRVEDTDMLLVCLVPSTSIISAVLVNCMAQLILLLVEVILLVLIMAMFAYSLMHARDNQLKLLNYQINPHFLYNALDMINWQAIDQGIEEIYRPIQALSRFYKLALNHGMDDIRVKDEMEQLRLYLELQNFRFANSISYCFDIETTAEECRILHMVLLPILENAILHGIREKEGHCGRIRIACRSEGRDLRFVIADDGVGMAPEKVESLLSHSTSGGYGLANVQDRIRLCYGGRYGIDVRSAQGRGTEVHVLLPAVAQNPPLRR